jgi:exosortase K
MRSNKKLRSISQLTAVLAGAAALKFYYSTASVNGLRWILAPTTSLVELINGERFTFESNAGYMSGDHSFIIAAACSGVNFLITAFLMLAVMKLWKSRTTAISWMFIPSSAVIAYLATIIANTVRIATAMRFRRMDPETVWLNPDQLHRFEGIFIYFGFLLLLFILAEMVDPDRTSVHRDKFGHLKRWPVPLLIYYTTTLGIPLANGAYRLGMDFVEHALFVLATPMIFVIPISIFLYLREQRAANGNVIGHPEHSPLRS